MNITHFSTWDTTGGAARAAYRLHQSLRSLGQNSQMAVLTKNSSDDSVIQFTPSMRWSIRIKRGLRRRLLARAAARLSSLPSGSSIFTDDRSQFTTEPLSMVEGSDVINLHWMSGFIDYSHFLPALPRDLPIVWTLHDMNALTGGCHFDAGCGRFSQSCGCCPQLNSNSPNDFSARSWARKRSAYQCLSPGALHLVTPSQWLAQEVRRSSLLRGLELTVIPYGVDTEIFQPRDRSFSRDTLGLPQHHNVALFLASGPSETRKGLVLLLSAIRDMPDRANLCLLVVGQGRLELPSDVPTVRLEYIRDDRMLSTIYSAADIFLLPALQDNLPNTALEAMACGVPVVAFAVGGIPEMIRDGVEGRLVTGGDVAALRSAILATLHDEQLRAVMASNARSRALQEYTPEKQALRYLELYRSLRRTSE